MLRAHITGEDEEAQRAFGQQLAATGDVSGLAVLVTAAFVTAARRKFAAGWNRAAVIRYVGRVRALLSERPGLGAFLMNKEFHFLFETIKINIQNRNRNLLMQHNVHTHQK